MASAVGCHHPTESLSPRAVEFVYLNPSAKSVFLAGNFNGWNTTSNPMRRSEGGAWKAEMTLKPGRYEYKFIADGHWTPDPANLDSTSDLFGGQNSTITINPGPNQDGWAERRRLMATIRRLLDASNFDALEKQAENLRSRKIRFRNGTWELAVFYDALNGSDYSRGDPGKWREDMAKFDAWHQRYPESATAPVARAASLVGYAWQARGTGWTSEVSKDGWHSYDKMLQEARAVLEVAAEKSQRCPQWYAVMQSVALGQGWERDEYDRLFAEAVAREPSYYDYYLRKGYFLTPRWFGRRGEWEQFAEEASKKYDEKEGLTLYARIAWFNDILFGNIFRESAIQWPKMRDGFREIVKRWPDSVWNKNNFCRFACTAGDHATAAALFAQLGEQLDYDVWHSRSQFEAARRWAQADENSPSVQPLSRLASRDATRATAITTAPDEGRYFVGYGDGMLGRWDPEAGREFAPIREFDAGILQIAVAPGGKQIAVALDNHNGAPGSVKIINAASGSSEGNIEDWSGGGPFALCFSSDGSTLVAVGGRGGQPGVAKVWDARSGKITPLAWPQPKHLLVAAALSPDGRLLMTNDDRNIRVWDLRENKSVFKMSKDAEELVLGVAFSPDGKMAAAVCSRFSWESDATGLLLAWNTSDWSELKRMPLACGARHIAFSPDGRYVAATRHDNTISVWNTSDWSLKDEYLPMGGYIAALSYSSDGQSLAVATFEDGFSTWRSPVHKR